MKSTAQRTGIRNQILRFLLVGGINTLVTYAIFIGLGLIIPPWIAYATAFGVGMVWVVLGTSRFVFQARSRPSRMLAFAAWYLGVFLVGQLVIAWLHPVGFVPLLVTSAVVLCITTPLGFIGGRFLFVDRRDSSASEGETP